MLESTITKKIMTELRKYPGAWVNKNHGSAFTRRGIPDITFIWMGRTFFFEVKRPFNLPTNAQLHQIKLLNRAGAIANVVYSAEECVVLIKEHSNGNSK